MERRLPTMKVEWRLPEAKVARYLPKKAKAAMNGLEDDHSITFVVQLRRRLLTNEWVGSFWSVFTLTLKPVEEHPDRVRNGDIVFTSKSGARQAALLLREKLDPYDGVRIIRREVTRKETLIGEIE